MLNVAQRRRLPQIGLLLLGLALCLLTTWQIVRLHTAPAPFGQPYSAATPSQNGAVTRQLIIALAGLPLSAALLAWPLSLARTPHTTRWYLRIVSGACLLAALHGAYIRFCLPYGFGSAYEHTSPAQHLHLTLASSAAAAGLLLAVALLVLSLRPTPPRRR